MNSTASDKANILKAQMDRLLTTWSARGIQVPLGEASHTIKSWMLETEIIENYPEAQSQELQAVKSALIEAWENRDNREALLGKARQAHQAVKSLTEVMKGGDPVSRHHNSTGLRKAVIALKGILNSDELGYTAKTLIGQVQETVESVGSYYSEYPRVKRLADDVLEHLSSGARSIKSSPDISYNNIEAAVSGIETLAQAIDQRHTPENFVEPMSANSRMAVRNHVDNIRNSFNGRAFTHPFKAVSDSLDRLDEIKRLVSGSDSYTLLRRVKAAQDAGEKILALDNNRAIKSALDTMPNSRAWTYPVVQEGIEYFLSRVAELEQNI